MAISEAGVVMWVVYDHPKDFPHGYVARKWHGLTPSDAHLASTMLGFIRAKIKQDGFTVRLPRDPNDDPCILEMWL